MPNDFLNKNFTQYRESLLSFSSRFKVPYEVREEAVNDTILTALDSFDHDKGSFEGYCKVILKNKIFNFLNDKKNLLVLISLDEFEEIIPAPEISVEEKENVNSTRMFFERLKSKLAPDELEVFNAVNETCDQLNKINITKVSESLGIRTDVAWNIFRKIQRKANKLYKKLKDENVELLFTVEKISDKKLVEEEGIVISTKESGSNHISFQKAIPHTVKDLDSFMSKLSDIQINKINSIYADPESEKPPSKKPISFFKKLFSKNTK